MNKQTLKALHASIAKWEANAAVTSARHMQVTAASCPLCNLFNNAPNNHNCRGCPIRAYTRQRFCANTPYDKVMTARALVDANAAIAAAQEEVDFLKSLLP